MELVPDDVLEASAVVANCRMNRERDLRGTNGYDVELRFDPVEWLRGISRRRPVRWLDLCCGSAKALGQASVICRDEDFAIEIVGVDLVGMFAVKSDERLSLIQASLSHWQPVESFDLITCVHGLHYLGDKLAMIARSRSWLTAEGRFAANLDFGNIKVRGCQTSRVVASWLREAGYEISAKHKLIECRGAAGERPLFKYLGANDQAGPNYTGQPAVDSHYRRL